MERVAEEIKRLNSFDTSGNIERSEKQVCESSDAAVKHINDLLAQIKERRQECLDLLKTRLATQLKPGK